MTKLVPTACGPQDLTAGDILPLSRESAIATVLLHKDRNGCHWFSRPAQFPEVSTRFMAGSPFRWDSKDLAFRAVTGDVALKFSEPEVRVFRGLAAKAADIFSNVSGFNSVEAVPDERMAEISDQIRPLSFSLTAIVLNEMANANGIRSDISRSMRFVLSQMNALSMDSQAVLLSELLGGIMKDRLELALQYADERLAALSAEVDRLQYLAMMAEHKDNAAAAGGIPLWPED